MNDRNDNHKYDDIINLPHHVSAKHPQMSLHDRAAQFSPFAALTGYDAAVKETARLTDQRIEMDEYEQVALDERLQLVREHIKEKPEITILYFQPDERKDGGAYLSYTGNVKKIDDYERQIIMVDGMKIPLDDVMEIGGDFIMEQYNGEM